MLNNDDSLTNFVTNLFKCIIEQAIDIVLYGESEENETEADWIQ